ncbi:galactoside 2-alpha-L-fucosyltransferase-like [Triticum dicoccoides]|uniref:galactoside 2-alpha-L-fucosyltransferase-like n=1 Tax=Triticum dicoccoides TaxID=85692 RepID=UPI001890F3DC|nr:galactoside 2-alpha-L-fucosyltransferase-like [Triticum dicoccoides]
MDIKERIRRTPREEEAPAEASPRGRKGGAAMLLLRWSLPAAALVVCAVLLLMLAGGSAARRGHLLDADPSGRDDLRLVRPRDEDGTSGSPEVVKDKLLGLLAPGFDEQSCLSRYQSVLYRRISPHFPSTYLLERLREQEALQKKCGPRTELYMKAVEQLKSGQDIKVMDCNYLVWTAYSGLGNRILTIASAFLYAILTNRVLLVDGDKGTADLFCEPFPETSWLLPSDFPIKQFKNFSVVSPESYGNKLKSKVVQRSPAFVYLHLAHDYSDFDKLFFCEDNQHYLQTIPWLILKSDNYFVPSLFLIPAYQEELMRLFPQRDVVFHHLGRYLFHPSNSVWGMITRYYDSYLARADEKLGIQIRVFDTETGPFKHVMDQVLACTFKEHLLPEVDTQEQIVSPRKAKLKAVLVTSLNSGYYEEFRNMYWEHPTANGETISFHQPSHEEHQDSDKKMHNRKAWAEIYLLSLSDVMVTSAWSTFGYVAQGLSGLKPWLLFKPENRTAPDPPCRQVLSMEPCFHAPPFYDCKAKRGTDTGKLVPHVTHCEDMSWGLKLVDQS